MPKKIQNSSDTIVNNPIDFSRIDAYPLLPECEQLGSRDAQKKCFYFQLSHHIKKALSFTNIKLSRKAQDTIIVKIRISDRGKLSVSKIIAPNYSSEDLNTIYGNFYNSILTIPVLQPAIKSGIPVTTEFSLPLIFSGQ